QARVDRFGDPLPPGALARLGTWRLSHKGSLAGVAFSGDGSLVAAAGDRSLSFWEASTGKLHLTVPLVGFRVKDLTASPDGRTLLIAGDYSKRPAGNNHGAVRRWDFASGKELAPVETPGLWPESFALSPDGRVVAFADQGSPSARL